MPGQLKNGLKYVAQIQVSILTYQTILVLLLKFVLERQIICFLQNAAVTTSTHAFLTAVYTLLNALKIIAVLRTDISIFCPILNCINKCLGINIAHSSTSLPTMTNTHPNIAHNITLSS